MRIAFLITSMNFGGAEKQVLVLAQRMEARGHETCIISLLPVGPLGAEAESLGIPTHTLNMRPGIPDPRALVRLARILRRFRPDLLHSHMVHANLLGRLVRLLTPVPVLVSTVHNVYEGGAIRMTAYRLTDRLSDLTTAISAAAADRFLKIKAVSRIRVIPNGIDLQRFQSRPGRDKSLRAALGVDSVFMWLAVGRFEVEKDYPNMLQAAARALEEGKHTLLLVGDGSFRDNLQALAQDLGLSRRVRFLGLRTDVPDLMGAADGYLMSSAWEGLPMVLLEASACGVPIVATQVGGNDEVVRPGQNGFLVPPGNPEALAGAMRLLMDVAPEERSAMGERGRRHVLEHYSIDTVTDLWEEAYSQLRASRANRSGEASRSAGSGTLLG